VSHEADDVRCPYGKPGDQLWVRESWRHREIGEGAREGRHRCDYVYRATENVDALGLERWKPSIHMPRAASRITLEVTGVRVERLQDISEADAHAEGVTRDTEPCDHKRFSCEDVGCLGPTHRAAFGQLWEDLNGSGSWKSNPWVWVIGFKKVAA